MGKMPRPLVLVLLLVSIGLRRAGFCQFQVHAAFGALTRCGIGFGPFALHGAGVNAGLCFLGAGCFGRVLLASSEPQQAEKSEAGQYFFHNQVF